MAQCMERFGRRVTVMTCTYSRTPRKSSSVKLTSRFSIVPDFVAQAERNLGSKRVKTWKELFQGM